MASVSTEFTEQGEKSYMFRHSAKGLLFGASVIVAVLAVPSPTFAQMQAKKSISGQVPMEVFGRRPFMQRPVMSPDGSKAVLKASIKGADYIVLMDLNNANAKPKVIVAAEQVREAGDRNAVNWEWLGNDNVIITLQSRENLFGQRADMSRLVGYNLKTEKMTPLAWDGSGFAASDIIHKDHTSGKFLLQRFKTGMDTERYGRPEVVRVDVETGKFNIVQNTNPVVSDWIADGKGIVRAGLGSDRDSGKQRLMYRSNENEQFRTVSNEADATFTSGSQIIPRIFLDEPDMAIAISNKDGFSKVYKINMKTMEHGKELFAKQGYDVTAVLDNWDENKLDGVVVTEESSRAYYFDPVLKTIQTEILDPAYGKGNASLISADKDRTKFLIQTGDPSQAGAYYLYDTTNGKFGHLGWVRPYFEDAKMNPMSTITVTARDGVKVPAIVTMPRHRLNKKNLPVVMMPHGGPFGVRDEEEFGYFPWHQALAEQGYVVVQPNYRGSGGYGKDFVAKGREKDGYGLKMQDDLNDVIDFMGKQGTIDPKRACIMGWSYGGYAAARGAQRDASRWKCAVAGAGVYDQIMMKNYDLGEFGKFGASFQATGDDLAATSPARNTDGAWSPILIVSAVRDARIPIEQGRTLVSRLKGSGKQQGTDFEFIEQPKGTHNLPYEDVHVQWLDEANKWIQRFNPAYIPSDGDKAPAKAGG